MSDKITYDYWIVAGKKSPINKNTYSRLYVRPYLKGRGLDKVIEMPRKEFMALLKRGKSFIFAKYFPETRTYEHSGTALFLSNKNQRKMYLWEMPYMISKDHIEELPSEVPDDWG